MSGALSFVRELGDLMPRAMTARAATILLHLRNAPDECDTSKVLQSVTGMSAPSVSRAVDTLTTLGYVLRKPRPKRSNHQLHIQLTADGYRIASQIEAAFARSAGLPPAHVRNGKVAA